MTFIKKLFTFKNKDTSSVYDSQSNNNIIIVLNQEIKNNTSKNLVHYNHIDDVTLSANDILEKFSEEDWFDLKDDLANWNVIDLEALALTIRDGNKESVSVDDHFVFIQIFTLLDDLSANYFVDDLFACCFYAPEVLSVNYFLNSRINNLKSVDLLNQVRSKLIELISNLKLAADTILEYRKYLVTIEKLIELASR